MAYRLDFGALSNHSLNMSCHFLRQETAKALLQEVISLNSNGLMACSLIVSAAAMC